MTTTLTPQLFVQLKELWDATVTKASLEWSPVLLYCGPYDDDLMAFSVKSEDGSHHLWVPRECRFGLRLMNHVSYCVWQLSRSPMFSKGLRRYAAIVAQYTDALRSRFFSEVLLHWYPAGTQLPTQARPQTRLQPLESQYLNSFLVMLFCHQTPIPLGDGWPMDPRVIDPTKFNWEEWAEQKPAHRILLGSPDDMSLEIDRSNWHRYTSAFVDEVDMVLSRRNASERNISESGLAMHYENPQGQQLEQNLNVLDSNTSDMLRAVDNSVGYVLELDRTRLLFIPPLGQAEASNQKLGHVVQVRVSLHRHDGDEAITDISSAEQASITRTIETLLAGHVTGLHVLPQFVTVEEVVPGYTLSGIRKLWQYGLEKKFFHGDSVVQPAQDKWAFYLEKRE